MTSEWTRLGTLPPTLSGELLLCDPERLPDPSHPQYRLTEAGRERFPHLGADWFWEFYFGQPSYYCHPHPALEMAPGVCATINIALREGWVVAGPRTGSKTGESVALPGLGNRPLAVFVRRDEFGDVVEVRIVADSSRSPKG